MHVYREIYGLSTKKKYKMKLKMKEAKNQQLRAVHTSNEYCECVSFSI